ncbi:Potassium uptake protein TrkH [Fulvivirga imtechensis AK7]|uniref:Potassium uptake protein TrkH n=1 Tax=Fulvivirga imtechensis AK7 TaxID=1237149 RepID=L8JW62_9BACT|nr:TrkH family potassium uptake protein [Fulvivirga imtechensis]ELR71472.1 Potassium uptake protein TrkH [Fulvivirga imtechensis AK7]
MRLNYKVIFNLLGLLLIFNGLFMWLCLPFSMYYHEDVRPIFISGAITAGVGLFVWLVTRKTRNKELKKRDGFLVVSLGWILMSVFGTLPFLLSGHIDNFTDAFFETVSGYTTTGASILNNIEALPYGLLFWRSTTQWVGGMGIIVLALAILPTLGIGGMQLFAAEASGVTHDKLKPKIKDTASRLWSIYLGLTILETVILMFGGMTFYDALSHSFTTMASGGFSPKNNSVAYYDSPFIQYTIIVFMIIAGTNFSLLYFFFKGKFKKIFANEEFRVYILIIVVVSLVTTVIVFSQTWNEFEKAFRDALFQVVSIISSTGFATADYTTWTSLVSFIFLLLMLSGASAGSTSGGIKVIRFTLLLKNSFLAVKRQLHPSAVMPVRISGRAVKEDTMFNVMAFVILYLTIFVFGVFILTFTGNDIVTSLGAVATCQGNIGPGLGTVGPVNNFAHLNDISKWTLSIVMILGRLELFTILVLLTPNYWRGL